MRKPHWEALRHGQDFAGTEWDSIPDSGERTVNLPPVVSKMSVGYSTNKGELRQYYYLTYWSTYCTTLDRKSILFGPKCLTLHTLVEFHLA